MSNDVYANGNAIACKAGDDKVIASFPDVCMSPPSPPAGPVPIPYPNSSFSKDTKEGSKTVKINNKETMLKDKSYYKTSPLGDEAATRSFGANIMSHQITGKTFFSAWSMDVKFEGENVDRHLDITTSNHGSYPAGVLTPNPGMEAMAMARVAAGACPCCGSTDCPAKFEPDEEPLGFKEFYGIDPETHPGRAAKFAEMEAKKAANCKCSKENRVHPEPPCDVFRRLPKGGKKHKAIESMWNNNIDKIRRNDLEPIYGPLKTSSDFLGEAMAAHPASASIQLASMLPSKRPIESADLGIRHRKISTDPAKWKDLQNEYAEMRTRADSQGRTNHLTPKTAGGCPTNKGNLNPHQTLCPTCQDIDDDMGKWQN